mmetsp:Transcript_9690/g.16307  ORF Transcript_9690/g.16307 Transcript_9690/m.16307 type:complete len:95 (-) Transcript_9690:20-304(-)
MGKNMKKVALDDPDFAQNSVQAYYDNIEDYKLNNPDYQPPQPEPKQAKKPKAKESKASAAPFIPAKKAKSEEKVGSGERSGEDTKSSQGEMAAE